MVAPFRPRPLSDASSTSSKLQSSIGASSLPSPATSAPTDRPRHPRAYAPPNPSSAADPSVVHRLHKSWNNFVASCKSVQASVSIWNATTPSTTPRSGIDPTYFVVEKTDIPVHVDSFLKLLRDESGGESSAGMDDRPCLEYFLKNHCPRAMAELCKEDCPVGVMQLMLIAFATLVADMDVRVFLVHNAVHQSVQDTLDHAMDSSRDYKERYKSDIVALMATLAKQINAFPPMLNLFFYDQNSFRHHRHQQRISPSMESPMRVTFVTHDLALFGYLSSFIMDEDPRVADMARAGILYILELVKQTPSEELRVNSDSSNRKPVEGVETPEIWEAETHPRTNSLEAYIVESSSFTQQVVAGLCAVFSGLPREVGFGSPLDVLADVEGDDNSESAATESRYTNPCSREIASCDRHRSLQDSTAKRPIPASPPMTGSNDCATFRNPTAESLSSDAYATQYGLGLISEIPPGGPTTYSPSLIPIELPKLLRLIRFCMGVLQCCPSPWICASLLKGIQEVFFQSLLCAQFLSRLHETSAMEESKTALSYLDQVLLELGSVPSNTGTFLVAKALVDALVDTGLLLKLMRKILEYCDVSFPTHLKGTKPSSEPQDAHVQCSSVHVQGTSYYPDYQEVGPVAIKVLATLLEKHGYFVGIRLGKPFPDPPGPRESSADSNLGSPSKRGNLTGRGISPAPIARLETRQDEEPIPLSTNDEVFEVLESLDTALKSSFPYACKRYSIRALKEVATCHLFDSQNLEVALLDSVVRTRERQLEKQEPSTKRQVRAEDAKPELEKNHTHMMDMERAGAVSPQVCQFTLTVGGSRAGAHATLGCDRGTRHDSAALRAGKGVLSRDPGPDHERTTETGSLSFFDGAWTRRGEPHIQLPYPPYLRPDSPLPAHSPKQSGSLHHEDDHYFPGMDSLRHFWTGLLHRGHVRSGPRSSLRSTVDTNLRRIRDTTSDFVNHFISGPLASTLWRDTTKGTGRGDVMIPMKDQSGRYSIEVFEAYMKYAERVRDARKQPWLLQSYPGAAAVLLLLGPARPDAGELSSVLGQVVSRLYSTYFGNTPRVNVYLTGMTLTMAWIPELRECLRSSPPSVPRSDAGGARALAGDTRSPLEHLGILVKEAQLLLDADTDRKSTASGPLPPPASPRAEKTGCRGPSITVSAGTNATSPGPVAARSLVGEHATWLPVNARILRESVVELCSVCSLPKFPVPLG